MGYSRVVVSNQQQQHLAGEISPTRKMDEVDIGKSIAWLFHLSRKAIQSNARCPVSCYFTLKKKTSTCCSIKWFLPSSRRLFDQHDYVYIYTPRVGPTIIRGNSPDDCDEPLPSQHTNRGAAISGFRLVPREFVTTTESVGSFYTSGCFLLLSYFSPLTRCLRPLTCGLVDHISKKCEKKEPTVDPWLQEEEDERNPLWPWRQRRKVRTDASAQRVSVTSQWRWNEAHLMSEPSQQFVHEPWVSKQTCIIQ